MPYADVRFRTARTSDGICLLWVTDPAGDDDGRPLTEELADLMAAGAETVVIDILGGSMLDRSSLAAIEKTARELKRGGGELTLVSLDPWVVALVEELKTPIRVVSALAEVVA